MCSFMGRGVIDVPLREVAEFLKKVENNLTWDNLLIVCNFICNSYILITLASGMWRDISRGIQHVSEMTHSPYSTNEECDK